MGTTKPFVRALLEITQELLSTIIIWEKQARKVQKNKILCTRELGFD